jgi:hypothetical protein
MTFNYRWLKADRFAFLGRYWRSQPVGVLVGSPLPRAAWIAEVHLYVRGLGEGLVLRQLGASVPGQRSHQLLRQFVKLADERAPRFQNPCHLAVKFQ